MAKKPHSQNHGSKKNTKKQEKRKEVIENSSSAKYDDTKRKLEIHLKEHSDILACHRKHQEYFEELSQFEKATDLKYELSFLQHHLEMSLNAKSNQIALLEESIRHGTEMRNRMLANLIAVIEKLSDAFDRRSASILNDLTSTADSNFLTSQDEQKKFEFEEKDTQEFLNSLSSSQDVILKSEIWKLRKICDERILDFKSQHFTNLKQLRSDADEKMEWILIKLQTDMKSYGFLVRSRFNDIDERRAIDEEYRRTIRQQDVKIKDLKREISELKSRINRSNSYENAHREKEKVLCHVVKAQNNFKAEMALDRDRLRLLCVAAERTIEKLCCTLQSARRIKEIIELCRNKSSLQTRILQGQEVPDGDLLNGLQLKLRTNEKLRQEDISRIRYEEVERNLMKNHLRNFFSAYRS